MTGNDNIQHIYPVNDLEEHLLESYEDGYNFLFEDVRNTVTCRCKCKPTIQYLENNKALVIHNSFDGRENFEWDNDVVKN